MSSPFAGIETASRALRAFQRGMETAGHNIANVNTVGYSRQVVKLAATPSNSEYDSRLIQVGSGVNVNTITRIRDTMLEARRQDAYAQQGQAEGSLGNLEKVQSLFLDVSGGGISNALDTFFNSWSALGSNPASQSNLMQVQSAGRNLASQISSTYVGLRDQLNSQNDQVKQTLTDIQGLANKIDQFNVEIRKQMAEGSSPNDLMDQRDDAVSELSKLVNVDSHLASDGTLSVYVGSFTLVDQVGATQFPQNYNASSNTVSNAMSAWNITSGRLKGLFDNVNQTTGYMTQLDNLANNMRTQVNSLHQAGYTANGANGVQFFNDSAPQTGAVDFALSSAVDTSFMNIAIGNSSASGDGSAAMALSALRDTKVASLGNQTIGGYYTTLVSSVGRDVSVGKNAVNTANALSEQVDSQVQEISGVNLDDEMADMVKFQRSYQAAAKVLSTMDQMTSDLIGMLNR